MFSDQASCYHLVHSGSIQACYGLQGTSIHVQLGLELVDITVVAVQQAVR